jgi:hypothetical protein
VELLRILSKHYNIPTLILNEDGSKTVPDKRTVNIARARNSILQEFYENPSFKNYELFAMMDSNHYSCQGDIRPNIVAKYLTGDLYDGWDSLSFARKPYYDLWAYSDGVFQIGCWCYPRSITLSGMARSNRTTTELATISQYQNDMKKRFDDTIFADKNSGKLVSVDSAFCGFALYKREPFRGCFYNGERSTKYMDKMLLLDNLTTYRIARNGQTDDCEHRHFHMMAKRLNNARIMIACDQAFSEFNG